MLVVIHPQQSGHLTGSDSVPHGPEVQHQLDIREKNQPKALFWGESVHMPRGIQLSCHAETDQHDRLRH